MFIGPEDESDAVQHAVIIAIHVLADIAQDEQMAVEDRLTAVSEIMAFALEAHPVEEVEEEDEDDSEEPDEEDEIDRVEWTAPQRKGFRSWFRSRRS